MMTRIKTSYSILLDTVPNIKKLLGTELLAVLAVAISEQLAAHMDAGKRSGIYISLDTINLSLRKTSETDLKALSHYNKCVEFLSACLRKEFSNLTPTDPKSRLSLPWF